MPQAKVLLVGAVRSMSLQDAKSVLTGGDDVVGAEQLVLQVDQHLGPEVAVVEGELNVAVIQISGNGFAAGAEVDNLASKQDLHVPGGEGQAQLTVELLVDASDEDMKENF